MTVAAFTRRDISLGNWRSHPYSTYSFQHVAEFVPSADANVPTSAYVPADMSALAGVRLDHPELGRTDVAAFLEQSHTDSFLVLREGKVLAEWHAPHARPERPHLVFSISKSITGLLAGIAAGDGVLDPDAPVGRYLGVAPDSAYATARVRDLLDMTVRLDFVEDYLDTTGPFARYRNAMLWNPSQPGAPTETLADVLSGLPKSPGEHGEVFFYASPNTDLLGLVIESATGRRYHEYLSERLLKPMGATGSVRITVDGAGNPRAAGGISITARDLALVGDLVMNDGSTAYGRQVVPAGWIADLRANGNREAWIRGDFVNSFPQGRYRSCWYMAGDARGCVAASGIHGQRLWVDPVSRVVAVKLSSRPLPSDEQATIVEFDMLAQIARAL